MAEIATKICHSLADLQEFVTEALEAARNEDPHATLEVVYIDRPFRLSARTELLSDRSVVVNVVAGVQS